ncbi:Assembly chaperone of RPL4 [Spathaspora sp. JA1]|nr:Assembly chaperone of RPL4 [Spathaspora sp. JA1]
MSTEIISQARALLETSQPEQALTLLTQHLQANVESIEFLSVYGETLLETNQLEQAYQVLSKACEMDPDANQGVEKFLYLGQIIGGSDGLDYINIALNKLSTYLQDLQSGKKTPEELKQYGNEDKLRLWLIEKLNSGIFSEIEVWMTDLCMEPEAESKCQELIDYSLSLDDTNPEAYSLLASIRISQQRNEEAVVALEKSWELFQIKKTNLEQAANATTEDVNAFEIGMEYVELIQPLLTLSRFAMELELYDSAILIASNVQDINDSILDSYYIEALANLFKAKRQLPVQQDQDYRDIDIKTLQQTNNEEISTILNQVRSSLTQGYKVINSAAGEDCDPGLVDQVNELLTELGGPIMSELMPKRGDDEEVEGWEDEIQSDEE